MGRRRRQPNLRFKCQSSPTVKVRSFLPAGSRMVLRDSRGGGSRSVLSLRPVSHSKRGLYTASSEASAKECFVEFSGRWGR